MGSGDEREGSGTALIVLRVVIRSPDLDTFVSKYSRFIKDDRIFIFTKASQPEGTRVRFTLELSQGPVVLTGEGTVTRLRPDTGDPSKPPGMELRFQPLDEPSRQMVARMLALRSGGEPQPAPPAEPASGPVLPIHPLIDDLSTKIRTTTPQAPEEPAEPPREPVEEQPESENAESAESTDVDSRSGRRRIASMPPSFTTGPTPLPAPLPLPTLLTPPHGAQAFGRQSQPNLPALNPTPPLGVAALLERTSEAEPQPAPLDEPGGALPTVERPPRVVESWSGPLPPPPGAPAQVSGLLPANPFSDVSDGAIEYFIEWSLEQSTAPRPKDRPPHSASFANVEMAAPRAEPNRERNARRIRLLIGMLVGLTVGIPIGAAGLWALLPRGAPAAGGPFAALARTAPHPMLRKAITVPRGSLGRALTPEKRIATPAVKPAVATSPAPVVAAARAAQPSAPPPAAELPPPPSLAPPRHGGRVGMFRITSTPPGATVTVKGEKRGLAPVEVELPPNHRYQILVEWPGGKSWHHRINLDPPVTEVHAVAR